MSEFLPGPRWRERVGQRRLWAGIVLTFAVLFLVGLAILTAIVAALSRLGAPAVADWLIWLLLAACLLPWTMRSPTPATASDYEAQPWTEYAVRAVMVGIDEPRRLRWRLIAVWCFGPPLLGYAIIYGVLSIVGIV